DAFSVPARAKRVKNEEGKMVVARREDGSIHRLKRKGGRYQVKADLMAWQPQLIVLDESHRIKSGSARKSQMLHQIGPIASYRVIATGTAVTKAKRIFDLHSQWKFLIPTSPLVYGYNLSEFKER